MAAFQQPTPQTIAANHDLPEIATTSSLVNAMVALDQNFSHFKASQKAAWAPLPGHPDISPAHEALLFLDQFREIARLPDTAQRPSDYRTELEKSQHAAELLRQALLTSDPAAAQTALTSISASCTACHRQYRR